jgi:small nuclear ribonucleoprotein (snRNP)-like protein
MLLLSGAAYAQDRATLTLRSGVKVTGQLIDLGGDGYTIVVNGNECQVSEKDVSVIDFSGSDMIEADWTRFKGTPQVVLKNGETIDGSLYDISGTTPLHLTITTRDGQRQLASSDVARILFSRPEVAVGTSGRGGGGLIIK